MEYLRQIESSRQTLSQILKGLKEIPQYYATVKGFDVQIKMDLKSVENEYTQLSEKYWRIFGSIPSVSIPAIQQKVTEFSTNFQPVYNKKDITKLKELIPKAGNFLNPIKKANRTMIERISWYEGVPAEIVKREKQLVSLKPNSKHASDANAYAEKTGNRTFRNYNPPNTISKLKEQLVTIRNFHTQKHNLDTIDAEFRKFDDEISKVVEYM